MHLISKLILVLFCFHIAIAQENSDSVCDPASVEGVFNHLNFVNYFQNELKEGIFWESTKPIQVNEESEIIYFSEPLAELLELNVDHILNDESCKQIFAEYLSGVRIIPGSKPASIPQTKWCGIKNDKNVVSSMPTNATNLNEILLGTIKTKEGDFDLILKGASLKHGSTTEKETPITFSEAIRSVILSEAIQAYGLKVVKILAVVGPKIISKDSSVVVLQIAPTIIRTGHIDHFGDLNTPTGFFRANDLVTFLAKHALKDTKLAPDTYGNCFADDDDDEEDDDEFCHRPNLDGFFSKISLAIYSTTVNIHYKSILNGLSCSSDYGVDGTIMDLIYLRIQEPSNRAILDCGEPLTDGNPSFLYQYYIKHTAYNLGTMPDKTKKNSWIADALVSENFYLPQANETFRGELLARTVSTHFFFTVETAGFYRSISNLVFAQAQREKGTTPISDEYKNYVYTKDENDLARLSHLIGSLTMEYQRDRRPERKAKMDAHNPKFVPREELIYKSSLALINGQRQIFEEVISYLRNPFGDNYPPQTLKFRTQGPQIPCRPEDVPDGEKFIPILVKSKLKKDFGKKDEL